MSNYSEWSVDDVCDFITKSGFEAESQYFRDAEIDGSVLPMMTEDHLKEIGINLIGPRLLILKLIRKTCGTERPPPMPRVSYEDAPPPSQKPRASMGQTMGRGAPPESSSSPAKTTKRPTTAQPSASNTEDMPEWKRKREKMIENIRAARKLEAWEKARAEGKDVGPPPKLPEFEEPEGLVACPVCGRKMSEQAAKHHIPSCRGPRGGRR